MRGPSIKSRFVAYTDFERVFFNHVLGQFSDLRESPARPCAGRRSCARRFRGHIICYIPAARWRRSPDAVRVNPAGPSAPPHAGRAGPAPLHVSRGCESNSACLHELRPPAPPSTGLAGSRSSISRNKNIPDSWDSAAWRIRQSGNRGPTHRRRRLAIQDRPSPRHPAD